MFTHNVESDKYGKKQVRYFLTQGDSCGIISTPKDSQGQAIDVSLIYKVLFKIYNNDDTHTCIFHKEMTLYDDTKYLFRLTSAENTFALGRYKYEIEYTFTDGSVNTPNQWYFEITEQAICK